MFVVAILLATIVSAVQNGLIRAAQYNEEAALVNDLFSNYNKDVKPTTYRSDQVNVRLYFILNKIGGIDERSGTMTTYGWMIAMWQDKTLTWDPRQYNGTATITVPADNVWKPEVIVYNSVVNGNDIALDDNYDYRVSIYYNGTVLWAPFLTWVTSCDLDVYNFPYDTQKCKIIFMNWIYTAIYVNYTIMPPVSTDHIQNSSEWSFVSVSTGYSSLYFIYPVVWFELTLKRVPEYFVFNIVMPAVCLSVLSCIVFLIPPGAGEKMGMTVTLLMSYSVILLMMADNVPRNSSLPMIMYYILASFLLNSLSVVASALVLHLHDFPGCQLIKKSRDDNTTSDRRKMLPEIFTTSASSSIVRRTSNNSISQPRLLSVSKMNENCFANSLPKDREETESFVITKTIHRKSDNGALFYEIESSEETADIDDVTDTEKKKWARLAFIIDRILLVLFLLATFCVSCASIIIITGYQSTQSSMF